jgi:hypothetical protein
MPVTEGTAMSSSVETRTRMRWSGSARADDRQPRALRALRVVDAGDLHQLLVFEAVAQDRADLDDAVARDGDRYLADRLLASIRRRRSRP